MTDEEIFLGGESGTLRSLYADRTGNWHLRNVWQGSAAIRKLQVATGRQQIILVNAQDEARLLDPANGRVSSDVLLLPAMVTDVAVSPNESRVLFRTGRWVHRAVITPAGLLWTDSIRAPKALHGSRMVFDVSQDAAGGGGNSSGDRVLILARDTGVTELTELRFSYSDGPALFGSRVELLNQWTERLQGPTARGFSREGF